ncbi:hypothetical protein AR457_34385 [Streptomyces agglomeratus]|uniref:hypothetical protein n=1 Tax=Streptomyces agglomeratus TaxID=285458 RepID=UPI00085256B9|nr:hypothetical protein [Streptomyces agglomeratus]OEJ37107.1 hypothetical protein BGK70_01885 [Streptomyces agglomeratus]OEJ48460.1 hypothetical protein AR457_34385 [Streptomyces agglomeratus]
MHDPATHRDDTDFDFGVTALGSSFHGDWCLDVEHELDHVTNYLGPEGDPGGLVLLVEDLLRLRDSDLSGDELGLLWHATDPPLGGAPEIRGAERAWLDRLLSVVVPLARARGASEASCTTYLRCGPGATHPVVVEHRGLMAEVVELIGRLDQRAEGHSPLPRTREALVRCAETVCSELAFRFLLQAAGQYWSRLSPETYERLERLSAAFGHGPYVVSAIRYLVDEPHARP